MLCITFIPQDQIEEVRIRSAAYVPPDAAISVQSSLVEAGVTVRNRKGEPVGGFKAADFEVLDNGKTRQITVFEERRASHTLAEPPAQPAPASVTLPGVLNRPPDAVAPAQTSPAPRYIALFFDDTHTGVILGRSKVAAEKFIRGIGPGDRVAIFTDSAIAPVDFTADQKALLDAVANLRPHPLRGGRGLGTCPTLTAYQAYVITQHIDPIAKEMALGEVIGCFCKNDDLLECRRDWDGFTEDMAANAWNQLRSQSMSTLDTLHQVIQILSRAPGARILIMISGGFVTGGMERQSNGIIDAALRSHIVINSLDAEGLLGGGTESPESFGAVTGPRYAWAERTIGQRQTVITELMASMSAATGGRFIVNSNDLIGGLRTLASEPEFSYRLGFAPGEPDDKYHPLKVQLKEKRELQVQFRPGYFSTAAKETAQQRIDRKVMSTETSREIPATVHVAQTGTTVEVEILVDAKGVPFSEKAGRHIQELTFVTVVQDSKGNIVNGTQTVMDLALTPETFAQMQTNGIKASATFTLPKGSYQVREVVREAVHNYFAAINTPAQVQ